MFDRKFGIFLLKQSYAKVRIGIRVASVAAVLALMFKQFYRE